MSDKPFNEKENKPTEESLEAVIKESFSFYKELKELTAKFKKSWGYTKGGGWMEKFHDSKKALFYFIPQENSFRISMAIRPNEREEMLADQNLNKHHSALEGAKKYSEGYHIFFDITDKESYDFCKPFMEKLISFR